jgi:hypothetical protein
MSIIRKAREWLSQLLPHDEIVESSHAALREQEKAHQENKSAHVKNEASTNELRRAIFVARLRTQSFAEFEQSLMREMHHEQHPHL